MASNFEMTDLGPSRNRRGEKRIKDEEEPSYGSQDQRFLETLGKKQVLKVCVAPSPYLRSTMS